MPAGLCLTTNEAPFAIAGCSDKLAVYRFYTGKYQPTCCNIDAATQCPIARVYANLQPEATDVASTSTSGSTCSSANAASQFDRTAAAQLAGIHSTLLLPIYDAVGDGKACQLRPLAVFELAHLEKGVDFSSAVHILSDESKACGFWVPEYSSAQPIKSDHGDVQQQAGLPSTPNHPGRADIATAQHPARLWSTNWLVADELPDRYDSQTQPQEQQQQRETRRRRSSVIYTEHYAYDQGEQCTIEPEAPDPAALQLLRSQNMHQHGQMQTVWESGDGTTQLAIQHQQKPRVSWDSPMPQQKQDYMSHSSSSEILLQQEIEQQLLWNMRATPFNTLQQGRRPSESKSISLDGKRTSMESMGSAAGDRVRAVVTLGGKFKHTGAAGGVEYIGGVQKVISVSRSTTLAQLMDLLSSRAAADGVGYGGYLEVRYALPGVAGSFIDIKTEEDLTNMFDELDDFAAHTTAGMARLQLYVDTTASNSSYEGFSSGAPSSSGGSDVASYLKAAKVGACQLQPSTPTTGSNASDAADAAARLSLHPSLATVPSEFGYGSPDDGIACGAGNELHVIVPFCNDRSKSAPLAFPGFGAGPHEAGFGWGAHDTSVAISGDTDESSEQFATAYDMTAALDSFHGDPEVAAVLAALSAEKAAALPGTGTATCSNRSNNSTLPPATSQSAALESVDKQDMKMQKDPALKQLVKQLKVQVEVIMPYELRVLRFIGGGAFGEVYLAKWHGTDVAVKCLHPSQLACSNSSNTGSSSSAGSEAAAELMREAATLAHMHHPNIVSVFGVVLPPRNMVSCSFMTGQELEEGPDQSSTVGGIGARLGGQVSGPAVVCEYMPAGSLQSALKSKAAWLNSNMAKAKVMLDTARGLAYLHGKSMVHFDLKSANLLYTIKDRTPTVKVADFGLSKQRHQTYVTGVDSMRGTLPWIAPEIIKNPANVSEAADIYSYGVILWEVWTGQEPFEGVHLHALLHQLTTQGGLLLPVPGSPEWGQNEAVPEEPVPGWCKLMKRCWSVNPDERPTSRQLVVELEAMMADLRKSKQ